MTIPGLVEVLLVEDNPADVELTRRALARANLANPVFVVSDGAEALDFLFGQGAFEERGLQNPRMVLLDLKLPRVNGLEVLSAVKADPRTRGLPVVVLTSSREAPDVAEAYRLGANSYIVKPVSFEAFVDAVSSVGLYWLLLNEPPR